VTQAPQARIIAPLRLGFRSMTRTLIALASACLLAGCSLPDPRDFRFPGVYRVTVQQGNVITQDMVDRLKPGMTGRQVRFIMGEPVISNTFRPNRWDYVYTIQPGGGERLAQRLTLYFEADALVGFEGDFIPTPVAEAQNATQEPNAALPGSLETRPAEPAKKEAGQPDA
jgi:outer membrane protein assembly factor BamE